jgi:drug/metabolite transporter (DMT)-like permease
MKIEPEPDLVIEPRKSTIAGKVAASCVIVYLLYIVLTAPNAFMPQGLYLLLLPTACLFSLTAFVLYLRGAREIEIKEAAKGFWLALILCFLVDYCVNLPYTFMEMIRHGFR